MRQIEHRIATLDETCTHDDVTYSLTLSMLTIDALLYSEKQFPIHLFNVDHKIRGDKMNMACD
jgi:hypothetical protein